MSYEGADMPDTDAREPNSRRWGTDRVDAISVVAGLLFIAIAVLALADRVWADIDPVLVAGGAVVSVGLAMMAGVILRSRRQRDSIDR